MTESTQTPPALAPVTPHLTCDGAADAIEFYVRAFGAVEEMRLPGPDGRLMHAAIRINGAPVMLVDENREYGMLGPRALNGSPVTIHLYVDDVDAVVARAVEAGATLTGPVEDAFWGDRYGRIQDPFGHHWSIATPQRAVSREELEAAMRGM